MSARREKEKAKRASPESLAWAQLSFRLKFEVSNFTVLLYFTRSVKCCIPQPTAWGGSVRADSHFVALHRPSPTQSFPGRKTGWTEQESKTPKGWGSYTG